MPKPGNMQSAAVAIANSITGINFLLISFELAENLVDLMFNSVAEISGKQQAENRTNRSWEVSICNSVREIQIKNKRRKAGGHYLTPEELMETLEEAYLNAIDEASLEVEEGRYELEELEQIVNREELLNRAMALILPENFRTQG